MPEWKKMDEKKSQYKKGIILSELALRNIHELYETSKKRNSSLFKVTMHWVSRGKAAIEFPEGRKFSITGSLVLEKVFQQTMPF